MTASQPIICIKPVLVFYSERITYIYTVPIHMQTCASGYVHTCTSGHHSTSTIILNDINSISSSHRLSSLSRCRDPANSITVAAKYIHIDVFTILYIANQAFQFTPLCQITRNGCFMKYGSSFLPPITQESFNSFPPHTLRRCSKRLRTLSGPCAT